MKSKILFKNTFLFFFVTVFTSLSFIGYAQSKSKAESQKSIAFEKYLKTGADQPEVYLSLLKDKKIGVLTNQTGVIEIWKSGGIISHSQNGCVDRTVVAMEKGT